jgi:phytoene/squalene synthetase
VTLLERFRKETFRAIAEKISLNPILNSFQHTVNRYGIEGTLIDQFLRSMEMDLNNGSYSKDLLQTYILGSAEAVGLMCLRVFCDGNQSQFERLKPFAMSLGSAFQKINFLRDLKTDYSILGRAYFPEFKMEHFDETSKREIERSIQNDLNNALIGIKELPNTARFGVYVSYVYYLALFRKIQNTPSELILQTRIRIRNRQKATLLAYSYLKHQFNMM